MQYPSFTFGHSSFSLFCLTHALVNVCSPPVWSLWELNTDNFAYGVELELPLLSIGLGVVMGASFQCPVLPELGQHDSFCSKWSQGAAKYPVQDLLSHSPAPNLQTTFSIQLFPFFTIPWLRNGGVREEPGPQHPYVINLKDLAWELREKLYQLTVKMAMLTPRPSPYDSQYLVGTSMY